MTQTRWGQVKSLFEKVADLSRSGRDRFLAQAREAPSVAAEVRILVEADAEAGTFMQSAALAAPCAALVLADGDLVSERYRIRGLLGSGGMGVVYRAEDAILSRPVALKFLHGEAGNLPPLERMKREARAAAALNHPNICVVYEIGEHQRFPFIAMELLEGKTLRERVAGRPIATSEFLDWAIQIAGAVEAAHLKGIIHRDIKPANIYITTHGQAKLLDFGLANTALSSSSPPPSEQTLTKPGLVMGTALYMSPEQARGEVLDARSDLFSFGVVLYEMATGKQPFTGATDSMIREAIWQHVPLPASSLNPQVPPELNRIITTALNKKPEARYQRAADLGADLKRLRLHTAAAVSRATAWKPWAAALVGVLALILLATAVFYQSRKPPLRVHAIHRQITFHGEAFELALSPDGKSVAYVAGNRGPQPSLILQSLDRGDSVELARASKIDGPRWSPDGKTLASYLNSTRGGIFLIPPSGGQPRFIAPGFLVCWSPDGSQVAVAHQLEEGFRIIDIASGGSRSVTFRLNGGVLGLDWSSTSNRLAILAQLENGRDAIFTVRPDGSQLQKSIEEDGLAPPRWSPSGDAVYVLRSTPSLTQELLKLSVGSSPRESERRESVLLSGLQTCGQSRQNLLFNCPFDLSADARRMAYRRVQRSSNLWLAQLHNSGEGVKLTPLTQGTGMFESPSLSPSGKWIAFAREGRLYKMPAHGGPPTQLTGSGASDFSPAWSPDEKQIAFGSNEGGTYRVWVVDADGKNRRQFANTRLCPAPPYVTWGPGLRILYQASGFNLSLLDPQTGQERPLVPDSSGDLRLAKYSPDGKKVAVHWKHRPQGGIWVISLTDGSQTPLLAGLAAPAGWSPDGKRIYAYLGNRMLSLPVYPRGSAIPHTVFSAPEGIGDSSSGIAEASVSPEGKTFVFSTTGRKSDVWVVDDWESYQQR